MRPRILQVRDHQIKLEVHGQVRVPIVDVLAAFAQGWIRELIDELRLIQTEGLEPDLSLENFYNIHGWEIPNPVAEISRYSHGPMYDFNGHIIRLDVTHFASIHYLDLVEVFDRGQMSELAERMMPILDLEFLPCFSASGKRPQSSSITEFPPKEYTFEEMDLTPYMPKKADPNKIKLLKGIKSPNAIMFNSVLVSLRHP